MPASCDISSQVPRAKLGVSMFITGDPIVPHPHPIPSLLSLLCQAQDVFSSEPQSKEMKKKVTRTGTVNNQQLREGKGTTTQKVPEGMCVPGTACLPVR